MEEDEINYRTLRKIQQMEKNSPILTDINPHFYSDLSDYLIVLNKRLRKESSSQKQLLIKDEIENTKKIIMNIYEQREKKILLAAISKARGGMPNLKNMIKIEKKIYDSTLNLLLQSRKILFEKEKKNSNQNAIKNVDIEEDEKIEDKQKNLNPIVRVTENIPEFIGTDEKRYNLRKNDVLSLPEDMNNTLSKRGVVKRIKQ
jgi:DNA replication initiation complex subunit (GINS family)